MRVVIGLPHKLLATSLAANIKLAFQCNIDTANSIADFIDLIRLSSPNLIIVSDEFMNNKVYDFFRSLLPAGLSRNQSIIVFADSDMRSSKYSLYSALYFKLIDYNEDLDNLLNLVREFCKIKESTSTKSNDPQKSQDQTLMLTAAETRIAKLIRNGASNKLIAQCLNNSEDTIKNHRKNIKMKLSIRGGKGKLIKYLEGIPG